MKALRLAVGVLVVGCSTRPLAIEVDAAGVGGGAGGGTQPPPGGSGGGAGGAGVGGAETGCAFIDTAVDCPGVEDLSLLAPMLADYRGDGLVSAGEAARFSITLEGGDQSFSYPSIGLTTDNPGVTISPAVPQVTLFSLGPHLQIAGAFDFLVDPSVTPGTVVHFTACPGRVSDFCLGGRRASVDIIVQPRVAPTWTTASGRPAGLPSCGIGTSFRDRNCAGLEQVAWSNPRAEFWQIGPTFGVSTGAWLTNGGARDQAVCATIAAGDHISNVTFQMVAPGRSAFAAFPGVVLDPAPPSGATVHFTAWTGDSGADCLNVNRIEFEATVP